MHLNHKAFIVFIGFLYFWGWTFIAITTLIALFKREDKEKVPKGEELNINIKRAYKLLWDIVKLPTIKTTIIFLLTAKVKYQEFKNYNMPYRIRYIHYIVAI